VKPIEQLLQFLTRPGVTEVVLASGRTPLAKVGGQHRALTAQPLATADIARMLQDVAAPDLAAQDGRPAQWLAASASAGSVEVTALQRADVLQVRFTLARATAAPPAPPAAAPPAPPAPAAPLRAAPAATPPGMRAAPPAPAPAPAPAPTPAAAPPAPVAATPASISRRPWNAAGPAGEFEALLEEARALKASDLHVVAGRPPLFRIAGELQPRGVELSPETVEAMARSVVPERLAQGLAQDGSCDFALDHATAGRFRANVVRQRTGLKVCLRVIPREVPTLASLGLPEAISQATHHHQGLIIVAGPSGSGKTSTLAAIVDLINTETTHHVITVEDPIEFVHPRKRAMMSQREVGTHTRTFASALKGSLREDPDVIVVGELRDLETVRMALSAGETGHLVVATMNTPSAAKTIDRLIDLYPPSDQAQVRMSLSTGLRLIVSQKLMSNADRTGLVVATELLPGSVSLGNLIREEKTYQIPSLQQRGKGMGIVRMDDSLAELVKAGRTTLEIAREYAESPDEVAAMVQGRPAAALPGAPQAAPAAAEGGAPAAPGRRPNVLGSMGALLGKK
jgi:twitching motility protein PilT